MNWDPKSERLRLKGLLAGRPLIGPRSVNVHLTNACDRKCCFCWYFSPLVSWSKKRQDIPWGSLERLIRDCASMGVEEMNFEGGEVMLYPHVAEAFRLVRGLGMSLAAYTHLAYGREYLDLARLADRLTVNLSAATPASYRRVHGSDGFKDVMGNLKTLAVTRCRQGRPWVELAFIVNERNHREIEAFFDIADHVRADRAALHLFEATVEMKELVFSPRSAAALRRTVERAAGVRYRAANNLEHIRSVISREGFLKGRTAIAPTARNNDRLFYSSAVADEMPRCYAGWYYAFVDEQGRVIAPCDNVGVCIAGDIHKRPFKDIWFRSAKFRKARRDAMGCIDIRRRRWQECRYCGNKAFNVSVDALMRRAEKRRG